MTGYDWQGCSSLVSSYDRILTFNESITSLNLFRKTPEVTSEKPERVLKLFESRNLKIFRIRKPIKSYFIK